MSMFFANTSSTLQRTMLILAVTVIFSSASFAQGDSFGYYWRHFDGIIPPDAFPAGRDINNRPIYIGQAYDQYLIASQIFSNDSNVYYAYHQTEFGKKDHTKILCTKHPEKLEWIKTDSVGIKKITGKHLVSGGWEPNLTMYIGRVRRNGEVLVGKVIIGVSDGLHVTRHGKAFHVTKFDVLSLQS